MPTEAPSAHALRALARKIDAFQDRVGRGVSWLTLGMALLVFVDVVRRYLFNQSSVWAQELEWHLFSLIYLLAAGYTMLYDEHVRVDILYSKLSPRKKAWCDFVLLLVFFFPSCLLILFTTWPFAWSAFIIGEGSPDPGGIPARWLLKSAILLGFLLLMLQGISQAIKSFFVAKGWEQPEKRLRDTV